MKKKKYEKPSVEVVVLKQKPTLLQSSVQVNDYTLHDYEEE